MKRPLDAPRMLPGYLSNVFLYIEVFSCQDDIDVTVWRENNKL